MYARQCSYLHEAAQPLRNVHSDFLSGLGGDPFAELFYKFDDAILYYWLKFLESTCSEAMIPQFPADGMLFYTTQGADICRSARNVVRIPHLGCVGYQYYISFKLVPDTVLTWPFSHTAKHWNDCFCVCYRQLVGS